MGKAKSKSTRFRDKKSSANLSLAPTLIESQKKSHKSKKEKLKEKKETFIQKLSSAKEVIESKKEGEHLSLIELLNSIKTEEKNLSLKDKRIEEMRQRRSKKPINAKQREQILATGKKSFSLVLQHPQFQKDPLATIREHMQNKLAAEKQ